MKTRFLAIFFLLSLQLHSQDKNFKVIEDNELSTSDISYSKADKPPRFPSYECDKSIKSDSARTECFFNLHLW